MKRREIETDHRRHGALNFKTMGRESKLLSMTYRTVYDTVNE